jgi:oxygen-independent coproporphyrinogen-3 oxidase
MKIKSVYVHIPFCIAKCNYCDFNSFVLPVYDRRVDEYLKALQIELELLRQKIDLSEVETIYFGGGTPSILGAQKLIKLLDCLANTVNFSKIKEITIEANPGTLDSSKLLWLKKAGFNRLSIGVQSFNNRLLHLMGRVHDASEAFKTVQIAREVGFNNINIDLIYGLPEQSLSVWKDTIDKTLCLNPEHISAYGLLIETNTPWGTAEKVGKLMLPDEDVVYYMYQYVIDRLNAEGYKHYEISNFCKVGKESMHNTIYWENKYYLGIGCGAASHYDNKRYYNLTNLDQYLNCIKERKLPLKEIINLTQEDIISETMFMGLRMIKGINIEDFVNRFNISPFEKYNKEINKLQEQGLIMHDNRFISLTKRGIPLANLVFKEFV